VIPPEFWGAWRRVSIALGGGPPHEPARVDWLQGPSAFADLRLPIDATDEPLCFAGTTTFSPTRLTWHHDLDLGTEIGADTGVVSWRDGDLVEEGVFTIAGRETPYVEVWRRTAPADEGIALRRRGDDGSARSRLVRIGDDCLIVEDDRPAGGRFAAARLRRDRGTGNWTALRSLGDASPQCSPDSLRDADEHAGWEVVEEWP
jgi:hypothetical protein